MNSHVRFERARDVQPDQEQRRVALERSLSRVVTSDSLFRGTTEIGIEHAGAMYRLKITRQGKLILNK